MDSIKANWVSIPSNTNPIKKKSIQKLASGRIAKAFGKILKQSSGPDKVRSSI